MPRRSPPAALCRGKEYGSIGDARNRADRTSDRVTDEQVHAIIEAEMVALASGRLFKRHWIVHYNRAGIQPDDAMRFIGKLIDLVSKQARRDGGSLTCIWVRERSSKYGEHIRILLHLPELTTLHNRTRRWIELAGGKCVAGVSRVKAVRGRKGQGAGRALHRANAEHLTRYLLKACGKEIGEQFALSRLDRKRPYRRKAVGTNRQSKGGRRGGLINRFPYACR